MSGYFRRIFYWGILAWPVAIITALMASPQALAAGNIYPYTNCWYYAGTVYPSATAALDVWTRLVQSSPNQDWRVTSEGVIGYFPSIHPNRIPVQVSRTMARFDSNGTIIPREETGIFVNRLSFSGYASEYEQQQCYSNIADKNLGCSSPDSSAGNPCNAATGNKYQAESDYTSTNSGLVLQRHYNSLLVSNNAGLGYGWTAVPLKRIEIINPDLLLVRQSTGRGEPFNKNVEGLWQAHFDAKITLAQDTTGFTVTAISGARERYTLTGQILSDTDPTGRVTAYGYDTVGRLATMTGPYGHTLTFGYDAANHMSSVTDPTGRVINYRYDTRGNLTRADYPDATAKIYHYESVAFPHHLTGISFTDNVGTTTRFSTYGYDNNGKATLTQHAQTNNGVPQEKFTLAYDSDTQTTVTDALGNKEVMTFKMTFGVKNLIKKVNQSDPSKFLEQTFNFQNNIDCRKDEEGRVTLFQLNGNNQLLAKTEGKIGKCLPYSVAVATAATRDTYYQYVSPALNFPTVINSPSVAGGSARKLTTLAYADARFPTLPTKITQAGFTPSALPISRTITLTYTPQGQVELPPEIRLPRVM